MSATVIDSEGRAEDDEGMTPDVDAPHLTAPANAMPTRNSKGTVTLSDCVRVFARQPSPPYLWERSRWRSCCASSKAPGAGATWSWRPD